MSEHEIPEDLLNSSILLCIAEYVRLERDREILRDHWFKGLSFMALAEKYDLSLNGVKKIVYGQGDKVLLRAAKRI
jgi:Mor family transcriptional regulator